MPAREISTTPVTVLLVCTGNICRSALGERIGRAYVDEALGSASGDVQLVSAGTRARSGSGMHPDTALVLEGLGGDPTGFAARQLEAGMIAEADLVLTLTREHRRSVLELEPRALSRTFTLREAVALLDVVGGERPAAEDFGSSARGLVAALAAARGRRSGGPDDDIADPMGRPLDAHQQVGQGVAGALLDVLAQLIAAHPGSDSTAAASLTSSFLHGAPGDVPADDTDGDRRPQPRRRMRPFGLLGRRGAGAEN